MSRHKYINTGKCIWCGRTESDGATFYDKPHIVPHGLGGQEIGVDVCDDCNHYFGTAWTDPNGDGQTNEQVLYDYNGSIQNLVKDNWHQLVMTFDAASSVKTIYVDGVKVMQVDLDVNATEWGLKDLKIADKADGTGEAIAGIDPKLTLGFMCSRNNTATGWSNYAEATNTFKGALDDFRIFNKALTESEVATFYNAEKP